MIDQLPLTTRAPRASGINHHATILVLGYQTLTGAIGLPEQLQVLSSPLVLGAAALMYCVEFFADKIPGVDTGWDALHTFIRIPAGALLAANGMADVGVAAELAAALVGGGLAATSHAAKAGSRVMINTSPEPFTNWGASLAEDATVVAGLWTALHHPWVFLVGLLIFLLLMFWLLPRLWRGTKKIFVTIGRLLGRRPVTETDTG
jgi:hypothetical protein